MNPHSWPGSVAVCVLGALAAGLSGCDRPPPSESAREWTPADHDHADEKGKVQGGASSTGEGREAREGRRGAKGEAGAAAQDDTTLVELTWQKQCAVCHGAEGHGDGPNGPMVKAPDLTAADWQAKVSDQEIAATIASGKNMMPKFDLPPEVTKGLIARIRASKGR